MFTSETYHVHINAVGVGPSVLEVLLQACSKWIWNLMEADELSDLLHLRVVSRRPRVKSLNDGTDVPKYAGVHQR